jgi:arylsulfatase
MGSITEFSDIGAGAELDEAEYVRGTGGDAEAQWLLHRPVRQVSRRCPVGEQQRSGPSITGPRAAAFQYFYGFIGGETHPVTIKTVRGTTRVEPATDAEEGYTLNEDLADHAISGCASRRRWHRQDRSSLLRARRDARAASRAQRVGDKYKGSSTGWDKLREETFARQKNLGVIPKTCELTKRHPGIPAWDAVDPKMKPVLCRQMEVYAGFMEQTDTTSAGDRRAGRSGDPRRHVVYLIIGDNGASAEGSLQGTFNEMVTLAGSAIWKPPRA